jgi:hypothetical protein
VSKRYGNGQTAAGIAKSRGAPDSQPLTGPGNSQPHKTYDCRHKNNKSGGVDVHAIKSYDASACQPKTETPQVQAPPVTKTETHVCGQTTITSTSTQVVGVVHNGHVISPNEHSAHYTKHGDALKTETVVSTQVVPTGEVCSQAPAVQPQQPAQQQPQAPAPSVVVVTPNQAPSAPSAPATGALPATQGSAPVAPATGGVLGAQTTLATPKKAKAHHGVLGTVANVAGSSLPFTGFPLWIAVLVAIALIVAGTALYRRRGVGSARM